MGNAKTMTIWFCIFQRNCEVEDMTHGLLESDSEGFSEMIHQIAEIERER